MHVYMTIFKTAAPFLYIVAYIRMYVYIEREKEGTIELQNYRCTVGIYHIVYQQFGQAVNAECVVCTYVYAC